MAVKDDAVETVPTQEGDGGRELVEDEDVKGFELSPRGPIPRGSKVGIDGEEEP